MDMTEGSAVKLLLIFSIPMLIGNIFQQIYNLADIIIVGRLIGKNAIASIGATNSISFFFFALCNGIATVISCMGLQFVVNGYGALATAAFTTTGKIEQIIHMPYQTLNAALATFCGQNYGAKKNQTSNFRLQKRNAHHGNFYFHNVSCHSDFRRSDYKLVC